MHANCDETRHWSCPNSGERARALDVHVPVRGLGAYDALQTTPSSPGNINQSDPS